MSTISGDNGHVFIEVSPDSGTFGFSISSGGVNARRYPVPNLKLSLPRQGEGVGPSLKALFQEGPARAFLFMQLDCFNNHRLLDSSGLSDRLGHAPELELRAPLLSASNAGVPLVTYLNSNKGPFVNFEPVQQGAESRNLFAVTGQLTADGLVQPLSPNRYTPTPDGWVSRQSGRLVPTATILTDHVKILTTCSPARGLPLDPDPTEQPCRDLIRKAGASYGHPFSRPQTTTYPPQQALQPPALQTHARSHFSLSILPPAPIPSVSASSAAASPPAAAPPADVCAVRPAWSLSGCSVSFSALSATAVMAFDCGFGVHRRTIAFTVPEDDGRVTPRVLPPPVDDPSGRLRVTLTSGSQGATAPSAIFAQVFAMITKRPPVPASGTVAPLSTAQPSSGAPVMLHPTDCQVEQASDSSDSFALVCNRGDRPHRFEFHGGQPSAEVGIREGDGSCQSTTPEGALRRLSGAIMTYGR